MCFTWPNLQALISEHEEPDGLQTVVGIYNMVWAGVSGIAFFSGGALLETLGLRSLFYGPATVHLLQLGLLLWLRKKAKAVPLEPRTSVDVKPALPPLNPRPIARTKSFLRMAWLANPFAYIAVNTIAAVVPGLAQRLNLSPMWTGFVCSIWFFVRFGTFVGLWLWDGWHYRFRWFITAFVMLTAGFSTLLLVKNLWIVVAAQIAFGMGLGLIYYSSLFYSMHIGDNKAEHGGFHEAAIGIGLFTGPAVGGLALYFFPYRPDSGALAVSGLLVIGLAGVLRLRCRTQNPK